MRHKFAAAILAVLFTAPLPALTAETGSRQIAGRIELHPIPTLTLSDQQFLTGDSNGKPVTVSGALRLPPGTGRVPVVVLMHGSGGVGPNVDMWAKEFAEFGFASFVLDGFTGRGLVQVSTDQAQLGRLNFILDIYRSLDILAKHPRVDPERIALMGFSRGGQAVLYASVKRFHQMWNKSGADFAAYVPFYPDCMTTYKSDSEVVRRPIRQFHGTPDDYNPVAPCKAYLQRLRAAGSDVDLTEYPNAAHGFDNPLGAQPAAVARNAQSVRNCKISEEPGGVLINAVSKEPFTYKDPCVQFNPHVGHDPEATAAAKQAVSRFLKTVFKLE